MKAITILICSFTILTTSEIYTQKAVQTFKGKIIDAQSEMPLIGATIQILGYESLATVSDVDGDFEIDNVPIGRQTALINYLGYEEAVLPNIELTSGKQVSVIVKMTESLTAMDEVVITAAVEKDKALNAMAAISTRQFSMEETNRFSGGRSDVGRLASNFAGVSTPDDSRNDIVIRGNSPTGLLWQLEGVPIPSPNHFSTIGTTGGPVSALNTNILGNSDFMTSAFPAGYGNAMSGVFDLNMRTGNKDEYEYTFQLGAITGIEAMAEGPINKDNGSSFLIAYRYSFLGVAQALNLDIGTNAVPQYQDLSFKLDFGKSKFGRFSLFGIGGTSDIEFLREEVDENDLFAADDEDAFADSRFGVIGLKHNIIIDDNTYLRTVLAASGSENIFTRERYYDLSEGEVKTPFESANNVLIKYNISTYINRKQNKFWSWRMGVLAEHTQANLDFKSGESGLDEDLDGIYDLVDIYNFDEGTQMIQPYVQSQYRLSEKLTWYAGVHGLYYALNDNIAIEPRTSIQYAIDSKQKITLGYGMHHQTQPLPIQLAVSNSGGVVSTLNQGLDFTRSHHTVFGYDIKINSNWRSKVEVYYQALENVPVDREMTSYSILNEGADFGFSVDKNNLVNEGTGRNYGVEMTLERFYNNGYYALLTGSIFESKYTGSDGVERNTAFNNQYVVNGLVGKEFKWGKKKQHKFTIDTRVTTAGGRYYTPVDLEASQQLEFEVADNSRAFSEQLPAFFRWDVKLGCTINNIKRSIAQSFYFDIQNVTNNQNIFRRAYNRQTNMVNDVFQIGFFPNFVYKVEF